jgi:hypothetical protein
MSHSQRGRCQGQESSLRFANIASHNPPPPLMALFQLSLLETAMQLIFCHVFPEAMGKLTHDVGLHSRDIANQTHHSTTQCVQTQHVFSLSLSVKII